MQLRLGEPSLVLRAESAEKFLFGTSIGRGPREIRHPIVPLLILPRAVEERHGECLVVSLRRTDPQEGLFLGVPSHDGEFRLGTRLLA